MFVFLALLQFASAGSLDIVEVAGPFGSPNSTDATASWWNPAGLASGSGTRFFIEGAPLFATIEWERDDPYYAGTDALGAAAVVPHLAFATDLGVDGLGLGASLSVPYARAGGLVDPIPYVRDYEGPIPFDGNPARYVTRDGGIQALQVLVGGGYDFGPVSIGAGGGLLFSTWTATVDNVLIVDLYDQLEELGQSPDYTDATIEDPRYATTAEFGTLSDTAFTFNAGIQVEPIEDVLSIGVAYHHSARVDNTGDLTLHFGCPPQSDALGRFGTEAFGLCNADINAAASVAYTLPSRIYGGVKLTPIPMLDVELMGGVVTWSSFDNFEVELTEVETRNTPGDFNDIDTTADLVNQERLWARENHNSGWVALDTKVRLLDDDLTLGARVTYDGSAVPDRALILNNYDASQLITTGLASYGLTKNLTVGATFSHYFLATRVITDTGFGVTLDPEARKDDRWFYPQGNGTYSGSINRIGISVQGQFGGDQ